MNQVLASFESRERTASSAVREPRIVAVSQAMTAITQLAVRAAAGDAKVLITGESGCGKDLIARLVHARSARARRPFVAVNCAAFSETLLEAELFGHTKGSFTGAYRDKIGKAQLAHTGTIFLDEIGEMSLHMQALLLRFLENGEIQPVGSESMVRAVDVRVISATNRDLASLVAAGQFREDLLYRIKVVHLHVPALRERREDIRPLIDLTVATSGRPIRFTEEALQALERHRWPGNVRQLQNVVEQLVWLTEGELVGFDDLPAALRTPAGSSFMPARERRRQVADELYTGLVSGVYSFWEHTYPLFMNRDITRHDLEETIQRALATTCGNYRAVIKLLGMPDRDYKRFLNFLAAHKCCVDYREFRTGNVHTSSPRTHLVPPVGRRRTGARDAAGAA